MEFIGNEMVVKYEVTQQEEMKRMTSQRLMDVEIPQGADAGDILTVNSPDGNTIQVCCCFVLFEILLSFSLFSSFQNSHDPLL